MDYKINIGTIDKSTIRAGEYAFTSNGDKLIITKGDLVIAEHKDNDWYFNGKSIGAIWDTLQNHYEVLSALTASVEQK